MAAPERSIEARRSLDELYRRHVGDVYRYAYAVLGNHADAEDVTQTTFVNALRALERGELVREPSRWLLVIAHNIVRQRWRHAASRPTEVELHDLPDESHADDQTELADLVRGLQRIPPAQREAIVMRELEGRSYQEISEVLGLSTGALETLLFRARRSLAEEMENLVTCERAELSISRLVDGRLPRKERRRLDDHLRECPECTRLAERQHRHRHAFKTLAVLPIPIGLSVFRDVSTATAASLVGIPTIGASAGAAGGSATLAGAAAGGGGLAGLGAVAAKVAATVAVVGLGTGVAVKGAEVVRDDQGRPPVVSTPSRGTPTGGKQAARAGGKAVAPSARAEPRRSSRIAGPDSSAPSRNAAVNASPPTTMKVPRTEQTGRAPERSARAQPTEGRRPPKPAIRTDPPAATLAPAAPTKTIKAKTKKAPTPTSPNAHVFRGDALPTKPASEAPKRTSSAIVPPSSKKTGVIAQPSEPRTRPSAESKARD